MQYASRVVQASEYICAPPSGEINSMAKRGAAVALIASAVTVFMKRLLLHPQQIGVIICLLRQPSYLRNMGEIACDGVACMIVFRLAARDEIIDILLQNYCFIEQYLPAHINARRKGLRFIIPQSFNHHRMAFCAV